MSDTDINMDILIDSETSILDHVKDLWNSLPTNTYFETILNDMETHRNSNAQDIDSIQETTVINNEQETTTNEQELRVIHIKNNQCHIASRNQTLIHQINRIFSKCDKVHTDLSMSFFDDYLSIGKTVVHQYYCMLKSIPKHLFEPDRYEHIVLDSLESIETNLTDAGKHCAHIFHPSKDKLFPGTPVLLIFSGLNQTQFSFNILIEEYTEKKFWSVVVINRRGICTKLQTPMYYSFGNNVDTCQILRYLHLYPTLKDRPFFAIGVSLGGYILTRYLCEYNTEKDRSLDGLIAVATISSPLNPCDAHIFDHFMHPVLMKHMKESFLVPFVTIPPTLSDISRNILLTPEQIQEEEKELYRLTNLRQKALKTENVFEFMLCNILMIEKDNQAWKILCETHTAEELTHLIYNNNKKVWECFPNLQIGDKICNINVPLLGIGSSNDILVKLRSESFKSFFSAKNSVYIMCKFGNHCYFGNGVFDTNITWCDEMIYEFFKDVLNNNQK